MSNFGDHPTGFFGDSSFYNDVATTSLRLAGGATLTNTYGTPTSRKKMSFGGWVKRAIITKYCQIWGATTGGAIDQAYIVFNASDQLFVQIAIHGSGNQYLMLTDRVFRDTSAWYHLWVEIDSTDGTDADRVKVYINGVRETKAATTTIADGSPDIIAFNVSGVLHVFGHPDASYGGDLYYSDWYFIDGSDVSPVDTVGEFKNGVFIPKDYSPTFGTNGWHLKFDQVGVGTASTSTIGADSSGKDTLRHWTSTADTDVVASDCALPDSPENNFSTFNPNFRAVTANTLSEGNLFCATSSGGRSFSATTIPIKLGTGKWFWEFRASAAAGGMGVAKTNGVGGAGAYQSVTSTGTGANTTDYYYGETNFVVYDDQIIHNGGNAVALDGSPTYPEVYGILFDSDASPPNMAVYRGGTAVGNIDCDNGFDYLPMGGDGSGAVTLNVIFNAGQDSTFAGNETAATNQDANGIGNFSMAVPTGAKSLCTSNISEPTIGANSDTQADDHFNSFLFTGNGGADRSLALNTFTPDWAWLKSRSGADNHVLIDSSRRNGANYPNLHSNTTDAEANDAFPKIITDGIITSEGLYNNNNVTFVVWNWKANGGTTSTLTDGTIDSVVQANTDAGFSIVTYTGDDEARATVAHGLSQAPEMVIVKNRDEGISSPAWPVYHASNTAAPATDYLDLNTTAATGDAETVWSDEVPTDTLVILGTADSVNSGSAHVMYCFHSVEGYSKMGGYTGNGNADGAFVYLGFRPAWIMFKRTDAVTHWQIHDIKRSPINPSGIGLLANTNDGDGVSTTYNLDITSNGFKLRDAHAGQNASGGTYIFMAFAEAPFKYANAR